MEQLNTDDTLPMLPVQTEEAKDDKRNKTHILSLKLMSRSLNVIVVVDITSIDLTREF